MLTILGPTATGKTRLAARLASRMNGEVISADSRQVYKGMDIGTGKDLDDYIVDGKAVPYHLINIVRAGEEYNVFRYRQDFQKAYDNILSRGQFPILCGGSGMYLESVLGNYCMADVPENRELRQEMYTRSMDELIAWLASLKKLHSTTDTSDRKRLYRAIEIETFHRDHPEAMQIFPKVESLIVGIQLDREIVRQRITERLRSRMEHGMVEEVYVLIKKGVPAKRLISYGLEYKYITEFLQGKQSYAEMTRLLEIAIHQFAKRQMTWFRRMEKNGYNIHWLDGNLPDEIKTEMVMDMMKKGKR